MINFLTVKQKSHFEEFGYVLIESGLEGSQDLFDAKESFKRVLDQVESGRYPYFRVYDDYFSHKKNVSGIEMPFHPSIIDASMAAFLNSSNLLAGVKDILGIGKLKLDLSRYHTTRADFGHIGDWHRDTEAGNTKSLQVSMFLFDEQGLEVIPKSHIKEDLKTEEKIKSHSSTHLKGSMHLKCKAGNILFFNPAILHRGICSTFRANIHFRFSIDSNYKYLEFNNIVDFNKDWVDILSNKNSIVINSKLEKYTSQSGVMYLLKKSLRTFVHYVFFFLPYNFFLFRKLHVHPNLKLRKLLYKNL